MQNYSNCNRLKITHKVRLAYGEQSDKEKARKLNKPKRLSRRFTWE